MAELPRIVFGSDHGGFFLKNALVDQSKAAGYAVEDLGVHANTTSDYPDFAHAVAARVLAGGADSGILVCGTGVGMSIAANRHIGIRAVVCSDTYSARLSRSHNATNVLCLGERVVGPGLAWDIVMAWLLEPVSSEPRHRLRQAKIEL